MLLQSVVPAVRHVTLRTVERLAAGVRHQVLLGRFLRGERLVALVTLEEIGEDDGEFRVIDEVF